MWFIKWTDEPDNGHTYIISVIPEKVWNKYKDRLHLYPQITIKSIEKHNYEINTN